MVNAYKSFKEIVNISFPVRSKRLNPYNAFMSANFSNAIDNSGVDPVIDYNKLTVSGSKLPMVTVKSAKADVANISIIYQTDLFTQLVNDQVVAVAKLKTGELIMTKQFRGNEKSATIFIPLQGIHPKEVHCCYLFALNADGS